MWCSFVDAKPNLAKLALLRTTDGKKIKIIESVAPIWQDLGDMLNFDERGSLLSLIKKEHPGDLKACCRTMFQHWLNGNGLPCTWCTLVELLYDLDMKNLAEEIESALPASPK